MAWRELMILYHDSLCWKWYTGWRLIFSQKAKDPLNTEAHEETVKKHPAKLDGHIQRVVFNGLVSGWRTGMTGAPHDLYWDQYYLMSSSIT